MTETPRCSQAESAARMSERPAETPHEPWSKQMAKLSDLHVENYRLRNALAASGEELSRAGFASVADVLEALRQSEALLKVEREAHAETRQTHYRNSSVAQDDLAAILRVVGLSDSPRPYSCHEVVQRELLPHLEAMTRKSPDDGVCRSCIDEKCTAGPECVATSNEYR